MATAEGPLAQLERPPIWLSATRIRAPTGGADVLDAHPQVAALSELRLFSNAGLEPPFRDSHWNPENSERMLGRKMGLDQLLTQERVTPTCGH